MYLNKVLLYGNITRDPELKALPSGTNVCSFSLATNRTYKDRDGKKQEVAEFHNIVVFGKTAENVATYMRKGAALYVEGRMQTRSWEQNGEKKYRTEVIAETVQFGPRKQSSPDQHDGVDDIPADLPNEPKDDINPDDIPF